MDDGRNRGVSRRHDPAGACGWGDRVDSSLARVGKMLTDQQLAAQQSALLAILSSNRAILAWLMAAVRTEHSKALIHQEMDALSSAMIALIEARDAS